MLSLNSGKFGRIVARYRCLRTEARKLETALKEKTAPRNNRNRSKLRKLNSDSLLCFLAILRELSKDCKPTTDSRNALKKTVELLKSSLSVSEVSEFCETYKTGGMFGQIAYHNPQDLLASLRLTTPDLTAERLEAIVATIEAHNSEVSELRSVAEWIDCEREELSRIVPENKLQADILAVLLVTVPENTWGRSQCHINHYCGIHGGSLEYLERMKSIPRCDGKRGNKGGSVNRTRGIRVLKSWGGYSRYSTLHPKLHSVRLSDRLYRKLTANYSSDSYGILSRKQDLTGIFLRDAHYRNSGPLAELYRKIGELLQGTSLLAVCQYVEDSRASERHLFEYRNSRAVEKYLKEWAPVAEAPERIRACERVANRCRLSLPGMDYQAIVSRPEYVRELELLGPNLPETVPNSTELRVRMGNEAPGEFEHIYSLPLYRVLTLSVRGFSWEYFIAKPVNPIPGRLAEACKYALGWHIIPDPIDNESSVDYWNRSPDVTVVVEKLALRINTELRQRKHSYRSKPGKVSTVDSRKFNARILRVLRNTETISIQDSTRTGNCEFGSREFAERLGIRESSVSGRTLAKHWRSANYPQNTLFFKVVESLPNYKAIAESVVAE